MIADRAFARGVLAGLPGAASVAARASARAAMPADEARAAGVEHDLGLAASAAPAEAIPRIDRFVCDLKESQFGDGLHVFGRCDYGDEERRALLDALDDAADTDRVGLINATALAHYVARDVSSFSGGKQNPDMEVRFDTTVFAVGL